MTKRSMIFMIVVLLIAAIPVMSVLANTIYLPVVANSEPTATPTPTVIPPPQLYIIDFNVSASPTSDYVEIFNSTSNAVTLTGWTVKAQSGEMFTFPDNFSLGAGKTARIRSGSGTATSTDLYWGLSYPLWVDFDNCAHIRNPAYVTVDSQCVPPVYFTEFNPSNNPQSDYVVIKNNTIYSLDMTGWWMKAESESGRYELPIGFKLSPLSSVRVRSGVGTDSSTDLYIGLIYSLWNRPSNCAYLRYVDGTLLDKACVLP